MLPHETTVHRKLVQALGALLLLGVSVALAAPRSPPNLSAHAPKLNTTLPVPATAKAVTAPAIDGPRPLSLEAGDVASSEDSSAAQQPTSASFPIRWRESREIAGPDLVSMIRNYRRDGLPVVHLWQSSQSLVAIGVNPHGLPGLYFTRHVGD